jgi:hypothetical protein
MSVSCFVGAVDKNHFNNKVIDPFIAGEYERVVVSAINLIKDEGNAFVNDSKLFLREFFDCMLSEEPELKQFATEVSTLCGGADKENLGYYSDYDAMLLVVEYLAKCRFKITKNAWWMSVPTERASYCSDSGDELLSDEDLDLKSEEEDYINPGTKVPLSYILAKNSVEE